VQNTLRRLAGLTARTATREMEAHLEGEGSARSLVQAEMLFKQTFFIQKLIDPMTPPVAAAQGLAAAMELQGKKAEAHAVLASVGLARKSTREALPPSYLRWLNKRVANYLDTRVEV